MLTEKEKQSRFNNMFFTLKIMALFFCTAPLFQYYFGDSANHMLVNLNIGMVVIFLCIVVIVAFMWIVLNSQFRRIKAGHYLEIAIFYVACLSAILYSGSYRSYYKGMFIFMIVVYTMDMGIRTGFFVASISALTIVTLDLTLYHDGGVNAYFQADLALSAMFFVVAWVLGFYVKLENEHIENLKKTANMDGLTGLYNHRYFYDTITALFENNTQKPLSFIMLDLDHFKIYNDMFGHQKGDEVLRQVSRLIGESARTGDVVCRYGGEEFTVIYPDTTQTEALVMADRLRQSISDYAFTGQEMLPNHNLTVSIGVAERLGPEDTVQELIERADAALYRAKFFRKNRVELYSTVFDQFTHLDVSTDNSITSVKALITIINSRDHYTYSHTERVVRYCDVFADYCHLSQQDKVHLVYAAYLHDIGKINVKKETLISEKRLTEQEWEEVKRHPVDSADIVSQIPELQEVVPIVMQHHERFDGTGYPNGLRGEEICRLARMLSLADSFDAMTAKRPYQPSRTFEDAFAEIRRCSGTQFDPALSESFIQAVDSAL